MLINKNINTIVVLFFIIHSVAICTSFSDQNDKIIFNHAFHISEIELDCSECHDGVRETEKLSWNVFPDMDLCLSCHDGDTAEDDCDKCHTKVDEPLSIKDSWVISQNDFSHKLHTNFIYDCLKCHNYITADEGTSNPKMWQQQECSNCHSKHEFANSMTTCLSCHSDLHNGNNGKECQLCHNTNNWIITNGVEIHQSSRFPLIGPHISADCEECHKSSSPLEFQPLNVDCYSCHSQDYLMTQVPNHTINNLSQECKECHAITSFSWDLNFSEHSFSPLVGSHSLLTCSECHTNEIFQNIDSDCYSCHQSDYYATVDPNHNSLGLSTGCEECHTTNPGWIPVNIDHSVFYLLTGVHINIKNDCSSCHTQGYNNTTDQCYSCHSDDYNSTVDPNHLSLNFSLDCEECHTTNPNWNPVNIDHSVYYPLVGGHIFVKDECSNCHSQGYNNTTDDCFICHIANYSSATDPNHIQYQFPQDCELCHTPNPYWNPIIFDHNSVYPLLGGHEIINKECILCHSTGFNNILSECVDCHITDYNATTDPNHLANQFPQDCELCHETGPGWTPSTFDHNSVYPLLGGHDLIKTECSNCHSQGYSNTSTDCEYCHLTDYNNTTDPNHIANQFSTDCSECHTTNPNWIPASIDHSTIYPLLGGHNLIRTDCTQCHSIGYSNTSTTCSSCHISDYNATTDPNHLTNQFPQNCETCHTTNPDWQPTTFDHNAVYPLYGGHNLVKDNCILCHSSGYTNTSTACSSCHISNYNSTTNPSHLVEQFSTNCAKCHDTGPGWIPTIFDHNTVYPLLGGHNLIRTDCTQCHSIGYSNTSSECIYCHLSDYNNTSDPNHSTNQFPQDCELCHDTGPGWTPSTFNHDGLYFPIYSGDHKDKWDNCSICHINPSKYYEFSCFNCHQHNENSMRQKHTKDGSLIEGYVYNSYACYDCHPNGD